MKIHLSQFYKKYPILKKVKVEYRISRSKAGALYPDKNTILINPNLNFKEQVKTLVHEAKHLEQYKKIKRIDPSGRLWNKLGNRLEPEAIRAENKAHYGLPSQLFADTDKDGVPNVFDCKPNNRFKQERNRSIIW